MHKCKQAEVNDIVPLFFALIREKAPRGKKHQTNHHCVSCDVRLSLYFYDEFRSTVQPTAQHLVNLNEQKTKEHEYNTNMSQKTKFHVYMHTYEHVFSMYYLLI